MLNRIVAVCVSALVPVIVWAAPQNHNGPIREITLSSGGLAEITRAAAVSPEGVIQLDIPLDQIDDILKSLTLNSAEASVSGFSLLGPEPLSESFKGLPFTAEALASVPSLLTAMQGASVTVTSNGKTVQGKVLGVESRPGAEGAQYALLSVLTPQGAIATLQLAQDASVTVDDDALRAKLVQATGAIARVKNDRSRVVNIDVKGATEGDVGLTYVVAAPIWKTAYKVVSQPDGKARLQVWAVLENATGEDWQNVKITLTSADPVTLTQRLHDWYWRDRVDLPVNTAAAYVPDADTGNLDNRSLAQRAMEMNYGARARASHKAAPAPMMAAPVAAERARADHYGGAMVSGQEGASASENDISATFALPGVHDLANGDTLSVPIVDAEVPATMVSLYRAGGGARHPVAALMIKNTSGVSLPPGILTVFDSKSGYVGDAQLTGLPSEDTRLASFATDRKVTITEDSKPVDEVVEVKVVDGMLRLTQKSRLVTRYTISGALDGARTVVVEHPIRSGWTFTSEQSDGKTASHYRLKADVGAGEEKTLEAVDEQLRRETFAVVDAQPDMLLAWSAAGAPAAVAAKLVELAEARKQEMAAHAALDRWVESRERLVQEQERIRQNLGAVPSNSDLSVRYLKQLESTENELRTLGGQRAALEDEVQRLQGRVQQILRTF